MDLPNSCKVAIVAALEREVWPMVRDWSSRRWEHEGNGFKFFENSGVVLVCAGVGAEAARRAAEAIVNLYRPALLVSAGFAGALDPNLQVGDMLVPNCVIDAADGSRTEHGRGEGLLVTFEDIADAEQKAKLGKAFGAHAVDMEAAAVARCAESHGVEFFACKVISDTSDSPLPSVKRFVDSMGRFHAARYLLHIAIRPWLWAQVMQLARNSKMAAQKLCQALMSQRVLQTTTLEKQAITR